MRFTVTGRKGERLTSQFLRRRVVAQLRQCQGLADLTVSVLRFDFQASIGRFDCLLREARGRLDLGEQLVMIRLARLKSHGLLGSLAGLWIEAVLEEGPRQGEMGDA